MDKGSCEDRLDRLEREWDKLSMGDRSYYLGKMGQDGCQEAVPLILKVLPEAEDPYYRQRAIRALRDLGRRDLRHVFVDYHLNDPDESVRQAALVELSALFRGERDREILDLALRAWDDPTSGPGMRLAAAAMMMYQFGMHHDELGAPAWWDESNVHELEHPLILQAVEETRGMLAEKEP